MTYNAEHAVATMIASSVRDMPGVIASGSPKGSPQLVYIVMNGDYGFRLEIVSVTQFGPVDFTSLSTEGSSP